MYISPLIIAGGVVITVDWIVFNHFDFIVCTKFER